MSCLRSGGADAAMFEPLRDDAPLRRAATQAPGALFRDYCPRSRPHWRMTLMDAAHLYRSLSQGNRKQINRLHKEHDNVAVTVILDPHQVAETAGVLETIAAKTYQRGLGKGFVDCDEHRQRMLLEAQRGWLRVYVLSVDHTPCAFLTGVVYREVFHGAFAGYDAAYKQYSPGAFLLYRALGDLYDHGVTRLDFGYGDAWYKQRLSDESWEEAPVYIFAPSLDGALLNLRRLCTSAIARGEEALRNRTTVVARIKAAWRARVRKSQAHV